MGGAIHQNEVGGGMKLVIGRPFYLGINIYVEGRPALETPFFLSIDDERSRKPSFSAGELLPFACHAEQRMSFFFYPGPSYAKHWFE